MPSKQQWLRLAYVFSVCGLLFAATFCCSNHHPFDDTAVVAEIDQTHVPFILGNIDPNRKYAVYSTTSNGDSESLSFIFLLPLTALAWKRIEYDSVVIIVGSYADWNSEPLLLMILSSVRKLDAVVIFLKTPAEYSVMISQVCTARANRVRHVIYL